MGGTGKLVVVWMFVVGLVGLPAFPVSGQPPTARLTVTGVTEWQPVTDDGGFHSHGVAWKVSRPMPAGDAVLVGADWGGDTDVDVEVRALARGEWSPWMALEMESDDAPDPQSGEAARAATRTSSAPVWTGPADHLQVRLRGGTPPQLDLHTVEISGGDGLGYVPAQMRGAAAQAAPAAPRIVSRSDWDPGGQCKRQAAPYYSRDVRFAVVHHTAGSNDYTSDQADDRILADCLYHVRSRGWDDLAYNFVVDKYGRVFEGRTGGVTEAVTGGHALGFNGGSTGVVLLGTYSSVTPPQAALHALRDLLAWKLDLHHVDPRATTTEVSGADTGVFSSGEKVTIPTIVGHRDLRSTSCPGDAAYRFLPWLRDAVAAAGAPKVYGGLPTTVDQPVLGERPRIDVEFSQATDWRLDITDASGVTVRSTAGGPADQMGLTWDLRDAAGNEVLPGTYTARFAGAASANPVTTTFTVRGSTLRVSGTDPSSGSVELSRWAFNDPRLERAGWPQSPAVVIASTQSSGEAYLAPPVAASYDAPLLLSPAGGLPDGVAAEIRRLGAATAYLVGSGTDLSAQVEADLTQKAGVTSVARLYGETPYHTAGRAGWRVVEREGSAEAVLVLGEGPDPARVQSEAQVAAAFAAAFDRPLLYVMGDSLPEPTKWVLEQRTWKRLILVGGKGVVTTAVKQAVATAARGAPVVEMAGATADETARLAADEWVRRRGEPPADPNATWKGVGFVFSSSADTTSGVPAAAAAAERGAAFVLVHPTDLASSPSVRGWVEANSAKLVYGVAAGTATELGENVRREADTLIRAQGPHTAPPEPWEPAVPPRFDDVADSVHRAAIERVAEEGIAGGCTETSYCPQHPVTRGQMATFITNAMEQSGHRFPADPADAFVDDDGTHHEPNINKLAATGIVKGMGHDESGQALYKPASPVTRAQMATFLLRMTGLSPVEGERFADVPASSVHAGAVNAIAEAGVTTGCAEDRFCPASSVTRGQMASFLVRALDREG